MVPVHLIVCHAEVIHISLKDTDQGLSPISPCTSHCMPR